MVPIPPGDETSFSSNSIITLNVGGRIFTTTHGTLTKEPYSIFATYFFSTPSVAKKSKTIPEICVEGAIFKDGEKDGCYFIDRNPILFEPILNYLRDGKIRMKEGMSICDLISEARFYRIETICSKLEHYRILIGCSEDTIHWSGTLNCQGFDLTNAIFRRMRLSNVDLTEANFSHACFEPSEVSHVIFRGANFDGADLSFLRAEECDFSGCSLKGANLSLAVLRGCNFKEAVLDDANLYGTLLGDGFSGHCDFSNASFQRANLLNANLCSMCDFTDANFEEVKFSDDTRLSSCLSRSNSSIPLPPHENQDDTKAAEAVTDDDSGVKKDAAKITSNVSSDLTVNGKAYA